MSHSAFALPERMSQALAGDTQGMSFADATWGIRFPEVDDLATLPKGARFDGLNKDPKNLERLRHADQLAAIKTLSTTSEIVHELPLKNSCSTAAFSRG